MSGKSIRELGQAFAPVIQFMRLLASEFLDKRCQRSAAALTYMTLFALVPMMTVMYFMFSMFPAFGDVPEQIQDLIFANLVPESGMEVQQYLADFSAQARSLTLPGALMLVATAFLMLTNIEKTFNAIWGVEQARKGLSSFLLYWAVLSIGPIFLGVGFVISTYLLSLKLVVAEVDLIDAVSPVFRIIPLLMGSFAFTLLFAAVPNCRVPIKYAILGGLATALSFEAAKAGFAAFVANTSFQLIYGAFAIVPLFLLWINFLWMIILLGAVFVRVLAEREYLSKPDAPSDLLAMLICLDVLQKKSQLGDTVSDKDCVAAGIGLVHWQRLRSLLVRNHWVAVTDIGNYVLSRDLASITLWDVAVIVNMPLATAEIGGRGSESRWAKQVNRLWSDIREQAQASLSTNLRDFYGQTGKAD